MEPGDVVVLVFARAANGRAIRPKDFRGRVMHRAADSLGDAQPRLVVRVLRDQQRSERPVTGSSGSSTCTPAADSARTGTPWYYSDRNNFDPRLGMAWAK